VGINTYRDDLILEGRVKFPQLRGCVEDSRKMQNYLQQDNGFEKDILVLNDQQATKAAIVKSFRQHLSQAKEGDVALFYYSGHGTQELADQDAWKSESDNRLECIACYYDEQQQEEFLLADKELRFLINELSQSKAHVVTIFDCCHSGGMTRDGMRKIRGITPPDDIRHRMLQWDARHQMWRERKLPPLNDDFGGTSTEKREFMGANHATLRLGRAMRLRKVDRADYDRLVSRGRPPYLPVLLEACRQDQLSYEYRHGVTSYGAFTFSLAKDLRAQPRITFEKIILKTTATLKDLGYDQNPQLVGPKPVTSKIIPGLVAQRRSPRRRRQHR